MCAAVGNTQTFQSVVSVGEGVYAALDRACLSPPRWPVPAGPQGSISSACSETPAFGCRLRSAFCGSSSLSHWISLNLSPQRMPPPALLPALQPAEDCSSLHGSPRASSPALLLFSGGQEPRTRTKQLDYFL